MTTSSPTTYYRIYKDAADQWRWIFYAANHKPIAVSSESYINKSDCRNGVYLIKASVSSPVYEAEST